jgi:hypothetical protein
MGFDRSKMEANWKAKARRRGWPNIRIIEMTVFAKRTMNVVDWAKV